MDFIKNLMSFYTQNILLNTIILFSLVILCWFLWTYRKLKVMALAASVKAEFNTYFKEVKKLEFAVQWLVKQKFYKNSILKFLPKKLIKWIINTTFKTNKDIIEAK